MKNTMWKTICVCLLVPVAGFAQEIPDTETVQEKADDIVTESRQKVQEVAEDIDRSQAAHEAAAGILKPVYLLAERMAFPAFHWVAFALMTTGVVSFSLQLILAKLVVLTKRGFSITEILADALGLIISAIGLVLTTQAAAENSTFTASPAAVLSATVVGVITGFIFYRWGQAHEVQAVKGRSIADR